MRCCYFSTPYLTQAFASLKGLIKQIPIIQISCGPEKQQEEDEVKLIVYSYFLDENNLRIYQ